MSRLPRVSREAYMALKHSLDENQMTDRQFALSFIEHLSEANPIVADCIYDFANKKMGHTAFVQKVLCMFVLYKLLENQAEAEELNELFGGVENGMDFKTNRS